MSLFAYFGFWALIVLNVIIKWRRGMLLDALAKSRKKEARAAARAARKQVWVVQGFLTHGMVSDDCAPGWWQLVAVTLLHNGHALRCKSTETQDVHSMEDLH